jgi:uncharacterized membrane protein YeaQ/YmgE (transglycosylase-associated protein family)
MLPPASGSRETNWLTESRRDNMGILAWILVGLVAGWLTGKIMKGSGYGFFVDIILGLAGALVGGFIANHLGLDTGGSFLYSTLIALGGAVLLVVIIRLLKRA